MINLQKKVKKFLTFGRKWSTINLMINKKKEKNMTFNYAEYRDIIENTCEAENSGGDRFDAYDKLSGKTVFDFDPKAGLGQSISFYNDGTNTYFEIGGAYMNAGLMILHDMLFDNAEYKSIVDNMVRESIEGLND